MIPEWKFRGDEHMTFKKYKQGVPYLIFLLIGIFFFPSAGRDDVHITYWAAYTLSNFGEILNYNGDRIEQSSSLLHTLILASINYISKINIVDIGTSITIFCGLLTIFLTGRLSLIVKQEKFFPQIITATSAPLLYWSFGALEASIVSAIILFLLITTIKFSSDVTIKNYLLAITAIILYLLIRPEAFFVISLFLFIPLIIFFFSRQKYSAFLILIATTIFFFIAIVIFRYTYFGSFFPQPVEAKMGASIIGKVYSGIAYYLTSFKQYPFLILLVLPIAFYITIKIKETIQNKNLVIIISLLLAFGLFIIFSGGDWMEGARFFVPTIGPAIIVMSLFYIPLIGQKQAVIIGVLLNLMCLLYFTIKSSTGYPIPYYKDYVTAMPKTKEFSFFETTNRVHYRDIPLIIEFKAILKKITLQGIKPRIMSWQAGMVPYHIFKDYYKQAKFIDLAALSTSDFTECSITNILPRTKGGISMNYKYFFSHIDELQEVCDIMAPDIIFDLDSKNLRKLNTLEASGYTLVYLQTGNIVNYGLFKGGYVGGTQFIAVKTDIVTRLGLKVKKFKFQ